MIVHVVDHKILEMNVGAAIEELNADPRDFVTLEARRQAIHRSAGSRRGLARDAQGRGVGFVRLGAWLIRRGRVEIHAHGRTVLPQVFSSTSAAGATKWAWCEAISSASGNPRWDTIARGQNRSARHPAARTSLYRLIGDRRKRLPIICGDDRPAKNLLKEMSSTDHAKQVKRSLWLSPRENRQRDLGGPNPHRGWDARCRRCGAFWRAIGFALTRLIGQSAWSICCLRLAIRPSAQF